MSKRNKELAKRFRGRPCYVCDGPGELDHILNYSGCKNRDVELNGWPLCRSHHIEKGKIGLTEFVKKYHLSTILVNRGFYFDQYKWRHEKLGK